MINDNVVVHGSLNGVVVSKDSLLNCLKQNKKKHDSLYDSAIGEYNEAIKEAVEKDRERLLTVSKHLKQLSSENKNRLEELSKTQSELEFTPKEYFSRLSIEFPMKWPEKPVSYENQYLTAIARVSMSIYDSFTLSETEFQSYVLNNWAWKDNFVKSLNYTGVLTSGYYAGYNPKDALSNF